MKNCWPRGDAPARRTRAEVESTTTPTRREEREDGGAGSEMDREEARARAVERRTRAALAADFYWACPHPSRERAYGGVDEASVDELPPRLWEWTGLRAESADRFERESVARVRVRVLDQAKTTGWDVYEASGERFAVSVLFLRVMEPFLETLGELQFRRKYVDGSLPTVQSVAVSDGTLVRWRTHRHVKKRLDFRVVSKCPIVQVSIFRVDER